MVTCLKMVSPGEALLEFMVSEGVEVGEVVGKLCFDRLSLSLVIAVVGLLVVEVLDVRTIEPKLEPVDGSLGFPNFFFFRRFGCRPINLKVGSSIRSEVLSSWIGREGWA